MDDSSSPPPSAGANSAGPNPQNEKMYTGNDITGLALLIGLATAVFAFMAIAYTAASLTLPIVLISAGVAAASLFAFIGVKAKMEVNKHHDRKEDTEVYQTAIAREQVREHEQAVVQEGSSDWAKKVNEQNNLQSNVRSR